GRGDVAGCDGRRRGPGRGSGPRRPRPLRAPRRRIPAAAPPPRGRGRRHLCGGGRRHPWRPGGWLEPAGRPDRPRRDGAGGSRGGGRGDGQHRPVRLRNGQRDVCLLSRVDGPQPGHPGGPPTGDRHGRRRVGLGGPAPRQTRVAPAQRRPLVGLAAVPAGGRRRRVALAAGTQMTPQKTPQKTKGIYMQGLTKAYGDLEALHNVSLSVEGGDQVALLGLNGSGKTTLLRIAAGLLEATKGQVVLAGQAAGSLGARAAVSYIPDNPVLYDDLSVEEHLEYVARLHGKKDWEPYAADLVTRLGLVNRVEDLPSTFSRGLRQKVSIALAFVRPFEVLLVDEPFVG